MAANTAAGLLSKGISRTVALNGNFQPAGEGQQAEMELFVEVVGHNPDLFIFGASQVAMPVAALASQAGFRVHVVDTRPRFANKERFPTASEILVGFPGRSRAIAYSINSVSLCCSAMRPNTTCRFLKFFFVPMSGTSGSWAVLGGSPRLGRWATRKKILPESKYLSDWTSARKLRSR